MEKYYLTKCVHCQRLFNSEEETCPHCGNSQTSFSSFQSQSQSQSMVISVQPLIKILIAVNVIIYLLGFLPGLIKPYINLFVGLLGIDPRVLFYMGIATPNAMQVGPWKLLSAVFLHGGLIHILFNMITLKNIGPFVIRVYRNQGFLFVYILAGIIGNVVAVTFEGPVIGASGAIFGLVGALIAFGRKSTSIKAKILSKVLWSFSVVLILIGFFIPMVSNGAHIAGLVTGLAIGYLFDPESRIFQYVTLFSLPVIMIALLYTFYNMAIGFYSLF